MSFFRELVPAQVLREAAWPIEQESWEGAESQWEEGNKELHILCKLWVSCECFPSSCVIPDPFLPEQVRQALEKGNQDVARIYAENAIRKKSESLNYLRMSGKVDAVAGRVKSAQVMKGVSKNMGSVVKSLDKGCAVLARLPCQRQRLRLKGQCIRYALDLLRPYFLLLWCSKRIYNRFRDLKSKAKPL